MEREEEEIAALQLTARHLASCGEALAHLPQSLLSVNYARRGLEQKLGPSQRKKSAKNQKTGQISLADKHCEFCCKKLDVKRDVVRVKRRRSREPSYKVVIKCGFCGRACAQESFKLLPKVRFLFIVN
jgi:hypothetical protein